jgi:RimJ/RimL family protein N-acetyltransferase
LSNLAPNCAAAIEFESSRLWLRTLTRTDADLYCGLYTDAATMRFIGAPLSQPRALKTFGTALRQTMGRPVKRLFLAIVTRTQQQAIGICSIELHGRQAEIGVILCAGSRARGYGTEVTIACITLAFAILPVDAVWLRTSAEHHVAERLAMGIGFSRGAEAGDRDTSDGRRVWSIGRHAWDHVRRTLPV